MYIMYVNVYYMYNMHVYILCRPMYGMYVCTYVRMYVCTYVRMYVCMYVCMCTYACMYS